MKNLYEIKLDDRLIDREKILKIQFYIQIMITIYEYMEDVMPNQADAETWKRKYSNLCILDVNCRRGDHYHHE